MLRIEGLSKRYGDVVAVDDVSLSVPRGRVVGFVGPNGAGKSTTMRSIFGLVEPEAGTMSWNDEPLGHHHLRRFGYMPEQRGLYPKMPIGEQISYFAELKDVDRRDAAARAGELLDALGLADRIDDPLEKLSHGNQQRVQLAVALANDPELLVLDEPFNGLDPVAATVLQDILREQVAGGAAVLFSSHQLDLVERLCDELAIIVDGRIEAAGTVNDVRREAGYRQVTIEIDRPRRPLGDALVAFDVAAASTARATVTLADEARLPELLATAQAVGSVIRFDYDLPSLEERLTSLVTSPAPTDRTLVEVDR